MNSPVVLQMKEGVQFPPICPNCAAPATHRLLIEKNFGASNAPNIFALRPVFCDACVATHRREVPVMPLSKQLRYWFGNFYIVPAIISLPLMLKFAASLTRDALAGQRSGVMFDGICLTFFSCIFAWAVLQIRTAARPYMLEPVTSVSSAFHFSTDMSQTFEPTWRRYTFRNQVYADAFAELNRSRVWDRFNPEAARARSLRFYGQALLYAALGAALLWGLWDDYLRPAFMFVRDYFER